MMTKIKKSKNVLSFTIQSSGGDGAYLCIDKVTKSVYDYFVKHDLSLEEYALNDEYADENNIPKKYQFIAPGSRAEFGSFDCGMTVTDEMDLTVENENSNQIYLGTIQQEQLIKNENGSQSIQKFENGIYAIGYEGLEDCYITGQIETDSEFDIGKFKVTYIHIDYQLGERELISSITYDGEEVEWSVDNHEGTGDNSFGFIKIK